MQSPNDIMQKTQKTLNNTPHHKTKANQQWFPQQQERTPNVFGFLKPPVHLPRSLKLGSVIVFVLKYCLTSPYRYLYNTDTSLLWTVRLVPEMPKIIHSLPL